MQLPVFRNATDSYQEFIERYNVSSAFSPTILDDE